jgi:anhydro-N-acetylmuramic acid kinase
VSDFRAGDVAAGGQGAPLAPLLHLALSRDLERPLAVLNVGGVANVTWIGAGPRAVQEAGLTAFDTGPGNALIDDWMLARTGRAMDSGGALAGQGRVHDDLVADLLANPYFRLPPPKSMDRNLLAAAPLDGLSTEDGAATLCALSARAAALAAQLFPAPARGWLVSGGGRKNLALMGMLADLLEVPVRPVEAVGWDGDMLEAQAFAYLAVRSIRRLPISLPGTTGVPTPLTGGTLHRAPPG